MTDLLQSLAVEHPIFQAPMAGGITTSKLVVEVANHGGLGSVGAGYMSADELRKQIREIKQLTSNPFSVNLFIPEEPEHTEEEKQAASRLLQPIREKLNITTTQPNMKLTSNFDEQIRVIIEEKVPICSFTFGLPDSRTINLLKQNDIVAIGTATTVREAQLAEETRLDAVVAQGFEAGGHRGSFTSNAETTPIGLMALLPQIVDQVHIPVIGAGGIMDGRGVAAALALGASAVQMGTAFLMCEESGALDIHRQAIQSSHETATILTNVFSGKYARGISNEFVRRMQGHSEKILHYPLQNTITQPIRKAAKQQKRDEFMSLWSGQSTRLAKQQTVAELMVQLTGKRPSK